MFKKLWNSFTMKLSTPQTEEQETIDGEYCHLLTELNKLKIAYCNNNKLILELENDKLEILKRIKILKQIESNVTIIPK